MNTDVRVSIAFEGIGVDKSGGYAFGMSSRPAGATAHDWVDSLTSFPRSVDTTVNPATGEFQLSSFVFELHNNDLEATTFLYQQRDKKAVLVEDSGATIKLDRVDMAGQTIYIGNETIKLGTLSAGSYAGCTRALYGSEQVKHQKGKSVFTKIPKLRGRGVRLLTFFDDQPGEIRWRGYIDSVETSDDGTIIKIMCREHLLVLKGAKVNRGAEGIKTHNLLVSALGGNPSIMGTGSSQRSTIKHSLYSLIHPETIYVQVGDALYNGTYFDTGSWDIGGNEVLFGSGEKLLQVDAGTQKPVTDPVFEVFVVESAIFAPTRDLSYPLHPLSIAAALLLSDERDVSTEIDQFNVLQGRWGAGLRTLFGPSFVADMHAMIAETWNFEVDFFLLGWDGKSEDLLTIINTKLLRPYGFYFGISDDGLLTIQRFGLFSVLDFDRAINNTLQPLMSPLLCKFDPAMGSAVEGISATVGEMPWRKGESFLVNIEGGDADTERLQDAARWTVDFSTIAREDSQKVISKLLGMSTLAAFAMPRVTIRVDDGRLQGVDLGLGELCILKDIPIDKSYFIDRDGDRLDTIEGLTEFAGIIIGRQFNVPNQTYVVTLLLTNFQGGLTRLRAPSAVVLDIPPRFGFVNTKDVFSGSDAEQFNVGDQVVFWIQDMGSHGPAFTILDISVGTLVLDGDTSLINPGQIIELAPLPTYTNRPRVGNTDLLVYNFLGAPEHIYG